ncbi:hypothetical protein HUV48_10140 [Altererythrobacter sp. HHU K3-1]|uniref:UvrD-like helicase C-terminal domain-containing protein n=2 Tax=Qipengyuania atrilutea TaxID=2744473 RepID=A0A850H3Z7_9SPHN|nr:hypothetical protein [Actirhodobacter atriluteus]
MRDHPPTVETAKDLAFLVITAVGESAIRQANPAYSRQADYLRVQSGLIELLRECADDAEGWGQVLDCFEGKGQVQLMTIHKSKGMEFHTMIFFGLDNQSWWSLSPQRKEELNSFFVAFTRARQRAFFTCCIERGGPITWLDNVLGTVVPRVAGCDD